MKELADSLSTIIDKLAGFFDIFDLSFVVSGATILAAVAFGLYLTGRDIITEVDGIFDYFAFVFISYVIGMLCFALGRWLRMRVVSPITNRVIDFARATLRRSGTGSTVSHLNRQDDFQDKMNRFEIYIYEVFRSHGLLEQEPFKSYLERDEKKRVWRLYVRMWAEAREKLSSTPSMSLLQRYWVMAATYDGLSISVFAWILVVALWINGFGGLTPPLDWKIGIVIEIFLFLCMYVCLREANRFVLNQVEELIATIAASQNNAQ